MSKHANRHPLHRHLAGWSEAQLADLLVRRPDLAGRQPPADLVELASRAQGRQSMVAAIEQLDLAQNRLLQLLACIPRDVTDKQLEAALPVGMKLADVEPLLAQLDAWALVWRSGDRVHVSGMLAQVMEGAALLGPPLATLLERESANDLRMVVRSLRASVEQNDPAYELPLESIGPAGRPERSDVLGELRRLLSDPRVIDAVLADAPPGMADLVREMAEGSPVRSDIQLYSQMPRRFERTMQPELWLVTRALLLPDVYGATQPREVGLALRHGRPLVDLPLEPPPLVDPSAVVVSDAGVDVTAVDRAAATVHQVADLCDWFSSDDVPALKDGGLGARAMKSVATRFDLSPEDAGRLVNLAYLAGLVHERIEQSGKGRTFSVSAFATTSDESEIWLALPPEEQWKHLAGAWWRSSLLPSAAGRRDREGKVVPAMTRPTFSRASEQRTLLLGELATLPTGAAASPASLTARLYWTHPNALRGDIVPPEELVTIVLEEAEALGVVAHGRLSSYGGLLIDGRDDEAAARLAADLPAEADGFTVQADHSIVAVGTLARETLVELRLVADLEAKDVATTFRITATSLRRAFDAGRSADDILAFLETHATRGVPQAISYLVHDVGRRYGNVRVGKASAFVRCDDPAVLADVLSHKKAKKLDLEQLAPTVAVSSLTPEKLLDGLRDAGFFPALDGDAPPSNVIVLDTASSAPDAESLYEPFEAGPTRRYGATLSVESAHKLAARLLEVGLDELSFDTVEGGAT